MAFGSLNLELMKIVFLLCRNISKRTLPHHPNKAMPQGESSILLQTNVCPDFYDLESVHRLYYNRNWNVIASTSTLKKEIPANQAQHRKPTLLRIKIPERNSVSQQVQGHQSAHQPSSLLLGWKARKETAAYCD